ncbi:hypothetical protein B0533_06190 [Sedimentibacter sp. SX930]|nr:hypothetical protein B0533_06190 [Sedimentibacter sp. SX930]
MNDEALLLAYARDLFQLKGIQQSFAAVLIEMMKKANNDQQIVLNSTIKKQIAERTKLTKGYIDNAITKLVAEGVLLREDRGVYRVDESYFPVKIMSTTETIVLNVSYRHHSKKITTKFIQ